MWAKLYQYVTESVDLLLPPACILCNSRLERAGQRSGFCTSCRASMPPLPSAHCSCCAHPFTAATSCHLCGSCLQRPPHFSHVYAACSYQGTVKEAIHRLKYRNCLLLAPSLGELLADTLASAKPSFKPDVIIPVPLHRKRLRQRGYNQALEISRPIARRTATPLNTSLLVRSRPTSQQQGLTSDERRKNLHGAFKVTAPVAYNSILLVDDVMTTGETVRACSRTLKIAGASEIRIAVACRA